MSRLLATIPTVWRQIVRAPLRSGLTVAGIAVAIFLFTSVEAMRSGVREAPTASACGGGSMSFKFNSNLLRQSSWVAIITTSGLPAASMRFFK